MVHRLPRCGLALLLGNGRTLVQPFVPHAYAPLARAGLAGLQEQLTPLSPYPSGRVLVFTDRTAMYKLEKPLTAFVIGAGGGLVVSGLLYGRMLVTLTGILWIFIGGLDWHR